MQRVLPFAFGGLDYIYAPHCLKFYNYVSAQHLDRLGENFLGQIPQVYQNLLLAIQDNDQDYLQSILEPKLFTQTQECLNVLNQRGIQLQYREKEYQEDEEVEEQTEDFQNQVEAFNSGLARLFGKRQIQFMRINDHPACIYAEKDFKLNLDVQGVFGPRINRYENQKQRFLQIFSFKATPRKYHINLSNPKSLIDNQILVLNALITTSKRIVGWQDGEIKYGQIDDSPSHHLLRLESYAPNFNWVITDIDNFMDGNPYY